MHRPGRRRQCQHWPTGLCCARERTNAARAPCTLKRWARTGLQSHPHSHELGRFAETAGGETLEFERDLSSAAGVMRTVVAFANTAGGTVPIGVEDGARTVRGVADPLALEERLASLLSDGIAPHLLPDIKILPWRSSNLLAVHICPSPSRPPLLQGGRHRDRGLRPRRLIQPPCGRRHGRRVASIGAGQVVR